jgi:hypothetical protein
MPTLQRAFVYLDYSGIVQAFALARRNQFGDLQVRIEPLVA